MILDKKLDGGWFKYTVLEPQHTSSFTHKRKVQIGNWFDLNFSTQQMKIYDLKFAFFAGS